MAHFLDLGIGQNLMLVKQGQDAGLVAVDLDQVLLLEIICLNLKVSMAKEPVELSACKLLRVEILEH